MPSKKDRVVEELELIKKEIVVRGADARLSDDLKSDAIQGQIDKHKRAIKAKKSEVTESTSATSETSTVSETTKLMLKRVSHAVLAAYMSPKDHRIAEYGNLAVSKKAPENLERLELVVPILRAKLAAKEIALVDDIMPDALEAQVAKHRESSTTKSTERVEVQTSEESLTSIRIGSREMHQRLKAFVRSEYGKSAFAAFGFKLPKPPIRKKKKKEGEVATPPTSTPEPEPGASSPS